MLSSPRKTRILRASSLVWLAAWLLPACGAESVSVTTTPPVDSDGGGIEPTETFEITVENVSGDASLATGFSPGVWATHAAPDVFFTDATPDRGAGLEALAEAGDGSALATMLKSAGGTPSGVFEIPEGATERGGLPPGARYVFRVRATPATPNVSFVSMFGQSNDVFLAPDGAGIPLFGADGAPLPERDVTELLSLWDAGTEINQAPTLGPVQGPRQSMPNEGPREGVLAPFTDTTRAFPSALQIAKLDVAPAGDDGLRITMTNVSGAGSSVVTGISPVFYAVHDDAWSLFRTGEPAGDSGLEGLAEDGDAPGLAEKQRGAKGVSMSGAAVIPDGADAPGGAAPGRSFSFTVNPDSRHRYLTVASMVGESNDAFLAFGPKGVALADESGKLRDARAIADDFARALAVWDAGTEANEVPGAGMNQGPRQGAPNTGPADPDDTVRRYDDATNDLAGPGAGGVVTVRVAASPTAGQLVVTVVNASGATPFPGRASPLVWAVHNGSHAFLQPDKAAPAGVERLAEDGNAIVWDTALEGVEDVGAHGVVNRPEGAAVNGPIEVGQSYRFTIPAGGPARYLNLAAMWTPSNDTFLSLGPKGVPLVDAGGQVRPLADINADLATLLTAWDAGTEANQAGALGPDQAPRQAGPDTGAPEGNGLVRKIDGAWAYPSVRHLVRVRVKPLAGSPAP